MKRPSTLKPLPLIHQLGFLAFSNKPKRAAALGNNASAKLSHINNISAKFNKMPPPVLEPPARAANLIEATNQACRKIVSQPPCGRKRKEEFL